MDIRVVKREIRKKILSIRDSLSEEDIDKYSFLIKENFFSLPEVKKAQNFFIFVNFRSEVKTIPIINELINKDKKIP